MDSIEWKNKCERVVDRLKAAGFSSHVDANATAVEDTLLGRGPDDKVPEPLAGARIVFNISNIYILPFVRESRPLPLGKRKPYKNGYDLGKLSVGSLPNVPLKSREIVDKALASIPQLAGAAQNNIYFGAVEINGAGIRFYGDICLVLQSKFNERDTAILECNSYELIRNPLKDQIDNAAKPDKEREKKADEMAGTWSDLGKIATIKVLEACGARNRRITSGTISDNLLDDEDYIEVLKISTFSTADLQEARSSAADVANETHLLQRTFTGPTPQFASLLWALRRRRAEAALKHAGVRVQVVTHSGRIRS